MNHEKEINYFTKIIKNAKWIRGLILIGSASKKQQTPFSDLDLVVLVKKYPENIEGTSIIQDILNHYRDRVLFHLLLKKPDKLVIFLTQMLEKIEIIITNDLNEILPFQNRPLSNN
ncbi:MAG: nucleotidyltransferase domain-containing protein [Promethearchaeota archaeon]